VSTDRIARDLDKRRRKRRSDADRVARGPYRNDSYMRQLRKRWRDRLASVS
jgi:hypothetical protein